MMSDKKKEEGYDEIPSDHCYVCGGKLAKSYLSSDVDARIEIYGDYWHRGENPQDRVDLFDTYGYKTLVIWEKEVHSMSEDEFVKLVFKFMQKVDLFYYTPDRVNSKIG